MLDKYEHLRVGVLPAKLVTRVREGAKYTPMHTDRAKPFGCNIPFSEPMWYSGGPSPYYNESHAVWRAYLRTFIDTHVMPFCREWDEAGGVPAEMVQKAADAGMLYASVRYAIKGLGGKYGKPVFGTTGLDFDKFDTFHDVVFMDEWCRTGCGGVTAAIFLSVAIAIPPIAIFGSDEMKERVLPGLLRGEKGICLAISEPYVGSDVAGLKTTAALSDDGKHYTVNGAKKFITGGIKADYFVTAVRTGGPGVQGVTLLLLEKGMPGIVPRRLKTQGWWMSNTALITFDNVRVPAATSVIGEVNQGFLPIMFQFNKVSPRVESSGEKGADDSHICATRSGMPSHLDCSLSCSFDLPPSASPSRSGAIHGDHCLLPLRARVHRGRGEARPAATHLRQAAHGPPGSAAQGRRHGARRRGRLLARRADGLPDGQRHRPARALNVRAHESDRFFAGPCPALVSPGLWPPSPPPPTAGTWACSRCSARAWWSSARARPRRLSAAPRTSAAAWASASSASTARSA